MKTPLKVETTITTPYELDLSMDDFENPQDGTLYAEYILRKLIREQRPFELEVTSKGAFSNVSIPEGRFQFKTIDEVAEKTIHTTRQIGPFFEEPEYEEYSACDCEVIDEEVDYEEEE